MQEIPFFFVKLPKKIPNRREFENILGNLKNFPRASPSGNFQIPSDVFKFPPAQDFFGKFPQKNGISYTNSSEKHNFLHLFS